MVIYFVPRAPMRHTVSAKTNAVKNRDGLDKMKVNEPERWKLG